MEDKVVRQEPVEDNVVCQEAIDTYGVKTLACAVDCLSVLFSRRKRTWMRLKAALHFWNRCPRWLFFSV